MDAMHQLRQDAVDMKRAILQGDIDAVARPAGTLLAGQEAHRPRRHQRHDRAAGAAWRAQAGAIGAKVSGAGGGGFMMFVVPTERRYRLISALNEQGAMAYPVKFTERGSETWALRAQR